MLHGFGSIPVPFGEAAAGSSYEHFTEYFLLGTVGTFVFEVFKLWQYYGTLPMRKWKKLPRSPKYWLLLSAMFAASGFSAWLICAQVQNASPVQVVTAGLAAPTLLRQFLAARTANRSTKLGDDDDLTASDLLR